jgi:hypothetical protein
MFSDSAVVTVSLFGAAWGSTAVIAMFGPTQFIVRTYDSLGLPGDFPGVNFIAVGRPF